MNLNEAIQACRRAFGSNIKVEMMGEQDSDAVTTETEKKSEYFRLCEVAEGRGWKPGWASYQYKDKFGEWPPRTWRGEFEGTDKAAKVIPCKRCGWTPGDPLDEQAALPGIANTELTTPTDMVDDDVPF